MRVVATAGHVDHGKSTLLQRLTGMEPDRWEQERRRGLTIDLGFVWTDLTDADGRSVTVAFVDVPGHDQFIPNMLSGVGVVDQVLFVVAADDGWAAQSEEHLQIVELLGLHAALVVVTKVDLAGEARTADTVAAVEDRLAATSLADAPIVVADAVTGRGLDEVADVLARRLHEAPGGDEDADARLWVDRAFAVAGAGTVVTGLLDSGALEVGDKVAVLGPDRARAPAGSGARGAVRGRRLDGRVRGLQSLGTEVTLARAGERVAINLAGVGHDEVGRGDVVVSTDGRGRPRGVTRDRVDVEIRALPVEAIGDRGAWHLHLGTASTTVRVRPLLGEIAAGASGFAQLELAAALPVRQGDRFVLRDVGRRATAGGGRVLDVDPVARPRGTDGRLEHALLLEDLAGAATAEARLAALVAVHRGVLPTTTLRAAVGRSVAPAGDVVEVADHLVLAARLADWERAAVDVAAQAAPEHAVPVAELVMAAERLGCPSPVATAVVERVAAAGDLVAHDGRYVHPDAEADYLQARAERRRRLLEQLASDPWNPPDPETAATAAGIPGFELQALMDAGELVACGPLLFAASTVDEAVARLRAGPGRDGAGFTAADAKEAWGTTRRAALPLLEHLRATRVTEFDGTEHRLTS
jgi:selenocysteine-specific elongation factor